MKQIIGQMKETHVRQGAGTASCLGQEDGADSIFFTTIFLRCCIKEEFV